MHDLLATLAIASCIAAAQPKEEAFTVLLTGKEIPSPVLIAMEREAQAVSAPSALTIVWKTDADRDHDFVVPGRMAIIHMRGRCVSALPFEGTPFSAGAKLGVTHISNHQILPIADVFCDAVREFVTPNLRGGVAESRDQLFGRALGRVLAHELYHILLQTPEHGRSGLSRAEQRATDLLPPGVSFTPSDERRIAESGSVSVSGEGADSGGQ
jgi:hypothetical protein